MIGYLKGRVIEQPSENSVLLGVGPVDSFVGYQVQVPGTTLITPGEVLEFHIYTHVREDQFALFGFLTREELRFFEMLLSVSGIGPKGAMSILSGASVEDLVHAIVDQDKERLFGLPGVGKKTAERLITELSDKLKKDMQKQVGVGSIAKKARASETPLTSAVKLWMEAKEALEGLGFKASKIEEVLTQLRRSSQESPEVSQAPSQINVEWVIKRALQELR